MAKYNYNMEIINNVVVLFREVRGFDGDAYVPEGVIAIGNRAFEVAYCGVKRVFLPSTLKKIGNGAFSCCEQLQEIIIPQGVEEIGKDAFYNCHSLKKIVIPDTVTSIGEGAFTNCGDIEEITVDENNPVYHSSGNCLIETRKKVLIRGCKQSVIPSDGSVTVLGENSFSNDSIHPRNNVHSKGLTNVVIPEGITKICKFAFEFNFALESVVIPDSVKTIEKRAFTRCYNLKSIELGNGVQTIGDGAFSYNENLKIDLVLPDSIKKIGAEAFYYSGIKNLVFGANVSNTGKNTFRWCKNLESVVVSEGVTEIGESCFSECAALKSITFPKTLKTIETMAFLNCQKLIDVKFNGSVENIGKFAFGYCTSLESIEIPEGIKYIGDGAFDCCEKLETVKMPSSIEFIGSKVFEACKVKVAPPKKTGDVGFEIADNVLLKYKGKSKDVIIPEGVKKIGVKAFYNKKYVETITLPSTLTSIANKAIERCANLKSIKVDDKNGVYRTAGNCLIEIKKKNLIYGFKDSIIPADGSVNTIAANAFAGVDIEHIDVPEGVKSIGSGAFKSCGKLKSVTLPQTLKTIGPSAFKYCTALESLTIPKGVTTMNGEAFSQCTALTEINFNADCCGDLWVSTIMFYNAGKNADGIIVNFGANVQRIPAYLFSADSESAPKIKKVVFAENAICESVGEEAFAECAELTSINLPDSVTEIGCDAFRKCASLESVNIPAIVTKIGACAFMGCIEIKEIVIPKGVIKLVDVFKGCGGLEKIEVEQGNPVFHSSGNCLIKTQDKILVRGCNNSVIPDDGSVVRIDNYAFDKCTKLESIVIPNGVTDIYNNAFKNCKNLKSVTIAETVNYVCNPYFEYCDNLVSITASKTLLKKYDYFGFKGKEFGLKGRRVEFSFL